VTSTRLPMHGRNHRPKGWFGETDPGGSDPLNWLNRLLGPARLDQAILASAPSGFWKLNEPSGDTVIDYSGNALDMTCPTTGGMDTPTRLEPPLPPGDPATRFQPYSRARRSWDGITGDFTAEVWVRNSSGYDLAMGQAQAALRTGGGWGLWINSGTNLPMLSVGRASGGPLWIEGLNALAVGAHAHLAVVHTGNDWVFYVNGLIQSTTTIANYADAGELWLGNDSELFGGGQDPISSNATLSYAALFPRALPGAELYSHFEGGMVTGRTITGNHTVNPALDQLLFATGTITVTYPTAVGRVGSSFTLKNKGSGTVTMTSTDDIDGAGSLVLGAGDAATIASDGVEWWVTGGYGL
jgi:hypothetical protein